MHLFALAYLYTSFVSHRSLFRRVCFQYKASAATIANIERLMKQFIEVERGVMEGILSREDKQRPGCRDRN